MKPLIQKLLKKLTYKVLAKQRPSIITITGSVGKTSTKEGIYFAVKNLLGVRRSLKNYNNELGVPFTVSLWGGKAPGKNLFRWHWIFCRLIYYSIFKSKKYPKWLVLEIGSDKPGDLQYLMEMIPNGLLKGAVLTAVFGAHLEFFKNIEVVYQEKTVPFNYVSQGGFILVNSDNCDFERIKKDFSNKAKIISYGFEKPADISAFDFKTGKGGLEFKMTYSPPLRAGYPVNRQGKDIILQAGVPALPIKTPKGNFEFLLKEAISAYQCYPVLAGVGAALSLGIDIKTALIGLKEKLPMPGRMRLIEGINNSLLIYDTYNSSPEAAKYALKALKDLPKQGRKIAVLGDMLELGQDSPKFHQGIGELAKNLGIDILITFGEQTKAINQQEKHFINHKEASNFLKNLIKPQDTILIKGSQGIRMEKIVKEIMVHPENAKDLLVRQSDEWVQV